MAKHGAEVNFTPGPGGVLAFLSDCRWIDGAAVFFGLWACAFGRYRSEMGKKSAKIAALIQSFHGRAQDAHYFGYFECFNRGLYYEAHEVLEELWLAERKGPNHRFYKGLIQFAGAFVHLRKNRLRPAAALFRLARANLHPYPRIHERLDTGQIVASIDGWLSKLEASGFTANPLESGQAPKLALIDTS